MEYFESGDFRLHTEPKLEIRGRPLTSYWFQLGQYTLQELTGPIFIIVSGENGTHNIIIIIIICFYSPKPKLINHGASVSLLAHGKSCRVSKPDLWEIK